jgi:hypothetical protein
VSFNHKNKAKGCWGPTNPTVLKTTAKAQNGNLQKAVCWEERTWRFVIIREAFRMY